MNVEKLYTVALSVVEDFTSTNILQTLNQVNSTLTSITSQPNNGTHLQQLSTFISQLKEKCEKSITNEYSPLWLQTLDELGIQPTGKTLFDTVDDIIQRNQLTVTVAQKEVAEIFNRLNSRKAALDQMLKAFSVLELDNEELEEGGCEVGIMIPRAYVKNDLYSLSNEFHELGDTLLVFEEVATGSRSRFKVNSIGSSDFGLYLAAAAPTALVISKVIEKLMNAYKTYWEVKQIKQELEEKRNVPAAQLEGLEAHIGDIVKESINSCIEDLLESAHTSLDDGRKNELRTELKLSMNKLANRMDRGFNLEIRVNKPQLEYDNEEESSEFTEEEIGIYDDIKTHCSNFAYIEKSKVPVIDLPETEDGLEGVKKKATKKATKKKASKKS